jgi:pullulanase/glycogen debranching enzyme
LIDHREPGAHGIRTAFPRGAAVAEGGVNFSLFSRTADGVALLLFDRYNDARPSRVTRLDPITNRTGLPSRTPAPLPRQKFGN